MHRMNIRLLNGIAQKASVTTPIFSVLIMQIEYFTRTSIDSPRYSSVKG